MCNSFPCHLLSVVFSSQAVVETRGNWNIYNCITTAIFLYEEHLCEVNNCSISKVSKKYMMYNLGSVRFLSCFWKRLIFLNMILRLHIFNKKNRKKNRKKLNFQQPLLQVHALMCWFGAQEIFLIIINIEKSCAKLKSCFFFWMNRKFQNRIDLK